MPGVQIQERSFQFSIKILRFADSQQWTGLTTPILRQLIRAGTSIGANITEAQGGSTKRDFINYLVIARKSAYETSYWLRLWSTIRDKDSIIQGLLEECGQITKILTAIILQSSRHP